MNTNVSKDALKLYILGLFIGFGLFSAIFVALYGVKEGFAMVSYVMGAILFISAMIYIAALFQLI